MKSYRPRRDWAQHAIALTRHDRGEGDIPYGEDGIAVDTVMLIVATIEMKRARMKLRKHTYNFEGLVRAVCKRTPFYEPREHAYEWCVLRYYSILSATRASQRRRG